MWVHMSCLHHGPCIRVHAVWRSPAPCAGPRVFVLSVIIRPTHDSATSKQTNIISSLAVSLSTLFFPSSSFTCMHVKFPFLQYIPRVSFHPNWPISPSLNLDITKQPLHCFLTLTHFLFLTISLFIILTSYYSYYLSSLVFPLSIYFACTL